MKYWQIILFSLLIGCLAVVTGLLVLHAQSSQAVQYHPANDMLGVAYGLAIAFNIVLALGSLPVLALKSRKTPKLWRALALLFALPLVFTIAVTWSMDFYTLFYCLPYLCSVVFLFGIRMAQQRNKPLQNLKTADPTTALEIRTHEIITENYLRLQVYSGNTPCGTIDFIGEKINFNIVGKYFFKGMEAIRNIKLEYKKEEILVFKFRNSKSLAVSCDMTALKSIRMYIKSFQ
ncbi:hypothetical protein [Sphingobacterium gobiense]|uniref:Uncharacterized protein n=1 Tax=Sphingobacterium gobiense TaxID=1382456 RepID=A0A2S9JNP9_9SPHI|nr:hypothetical protein [Sphingobacterium gobiense]PRD54742.1 hypothetical protein C5749_15020 [Sphingobacterium gobiense]